MSIIFPRWTNSLPTVLLFGLSGGAATVVAGVWYYFTPSYWEVGYEPDQPVDYNHQLHAGKLGIDCRYCHSHVEESRHANVPDTATCMSCHTGTETEAYLNADLWRAHSVNANLVTVRSSFASGEPIQWRRIHKLPDYVQFNHSVHVNAGISCYSCHGRIDELAIVRQEENLAMAWCLECHRAPEAHLVDNTGILADSLPIPVTNLAAVEDLLQSPDQRERGKLIAQKKQLEPPQNCGACHY